MNWPHDDTASLIAFYGDPRSPGFSANLVIVTPPWQLTYEGKPIRGVQIHKKLAASLAAVFADIAAQVGNDWTRLPDGATRFSGSYNFRLVRGSSTLSCHAFGAAIDMDAENNPMNYEHSRGTMSPLVINAFKRQGWFWGGDFEHRQDPMHFQAANESAERDTSDDGVAVGLAPETAADDVPDPLGSPMASSEDPQATSAPPPPSSMLTSKTGWTAIGLGGSGTLEGLRQANEYASEVTMAKWNADQLGIWKWPMFIFNHPMILIPIFLIGGAAYVWFDHRKYKRLLAEERSLRDQARKANQ